MEKPSLHEIAAMPFPQSEIALEKHYGVKPRREWNEGELQTYVVRISYSWRTAETIEYEVKAASKEDAQKVAEDMFDKDKTIEAEDADIDHVDINCTSDAGGSVRLAQ